MDKRRLRASPVAGLVPQVDEQLARFAEDYFAGGRIRVAPPQANVLATDGLTSVVLFREGQHQVELILIAPGVRVPPHVHDDVDSIEVAFSGELELFIAGIQCAYVRSPRADGTARDLLRFVPIRHDALHGGGTQGQSAIFLSVQRWRDGMQPSHVVLNWRGEPIGAQHAAALGGLA